MTSDATNYDYWEIEYTSSSTTSVANAFDELDRLLMEETPLTKRQWKQLKKNNHRCKKIKIYEPNKPHYKKKVRRMSNRGK